jgi:hypothetical protein
LTESTLTTVVRVISLEHPIVRSKQDAIERVSTGSRMGCKRVIRRAYALLHMFCNIKLGWHTQKKSWLELKPSQLRGGFQCPTSP